MIMIMNVIQFIFTVIIGLYFFGQLTGQKNERDCVTKDSQEELKHLKELRARKLTTPLTERTRPKNLNEIIGQEDGIKALRIALGGRSPQHVLIYGPPGVGKTAAARAALEWAKHTKETPFGADAPFVELDANTLQYDERCIADPLIGAVHDPIYQGSGSYGNCGIPQIKEGAVTRANGGVLFLDEIGELPSAQMNRLLKVLEDRRVMFESSYYSKNNHSIPKHIHDMFENGLPADFRLIGATTRKPEEIPEAIRSRCMEIYFDGLCVQDLEQIMENAANKSSIHVPEEVIRSLCAYISNGREGVKLIDMLRAKAELEERREITMEDARWVLSAGHYRKRMIVVNRGNGIMQG